MVVRKDNDNQTSAAKYNLNRKAGKSIIDRKPVFSPDGESVIVVVQNVARVYNIETGDCSRILETQDAINEIIAIQFPENDAYNLYGCSDTGLLTVWTWENGAVLKELKLNIPADSTILTFDLIDSNECVLTAKKNNDKFLYLASYSMKTGDVVYVYKSTRIPYLGIICVSLGECAGDKYVAVCNGTKCLFVQNLIQPHLRAEIFNYNQIRIVSVAAHPTQSCVSITDALGRVTIYRGYLYSHMNLAREVLHWHYLPPLATCIPKEGSYLLSGGMEKVLVKWTVGNLANKAAEKQFIPRLPGMVKHIATNNTHIAVSLTNNSVVIASAQMRIVSTILECGGLSPAARVLGTSLLHHRPLGALLLGGRTGHLQLCSTNTDKVLYNIDITQMNNIPPTRENLLPLETELTCAAVSGDGAWLVTSEYRNDGVTYPEERLKFWILSDQDTTPFKLNTCVNLSHGGCQIVSLALNNSGDFCVSAGADQKFRIWKRGTSQNLNKKTISWRCLTACYYSSGVAQSLAHGILNNFKNSDFTTDNTEAHAYMTQERKNGSDIIQRIMNLNKEDSLVDQKNVNLGFKKNDELDIGGVAISQDGSLIAAWFGCKLTLWDTHLCSLRTVLSHPALRPKGSRVQFGNNDAAHYLVCTTEQCLVVWSLLSLTVKWMVPIKTSCLAADPSSNRMAVVTTNNDVFVFTPHSSAPLLTRERLLNPNTGLIKQCTFGTSSGDDIRLYLMRNDSEIYCLEPEQSEEARLEVISRRNLPASNFSALIAEQQSSEVKSARPVSLDQVDSDGLGRGAISQFLSGAPHMMPPVSLLCTSFLEHISGRREGDSDRPPDDAIELMDLDQASSDEETPVRTGGAFVPKKTELWTPNYEVVKKKRLKKIMKEPILEPHIMRSLFGSIKPWSPKIVATIDDAMVFEDLDAMGYKINDKFRRLDVAHTLQGLGTLARLHASSIIFEEKKKSELKKPYCLIDDCKALLRDGGYVETYPWFMQCQKGGLEAIKAYSKYSQEEVLQGIESTWANVWNTALQISGCSTEHRNVVCHRDLWNNNIFFSYKEVSGTLEPDDCVLVDFQATKYQPPTCDVMLFLYCNLERNLREENMGAFLNFYYNELGAILMEHNVAISDVIPKESFMTSAEQQRQWGLIAYACLMPTIFTNDEIATRIFTDTKQFDHIMNEDKGSFMKARMKEDMHYRNIVLETLEEIIERYCLRM